MDNPKPSKELETILFLEKYKYMGGGYYRDNSVPKNERAEIFHADKAIEKAIQMQQENNNE